MAWRRVDLVGFTLMVLMAWMVVNAGADECPERIAEAEALMGQAEQALTQRGDTAERATLQAKLQEARAQLEEAQTLHTTEQHDASVDKAYAALARVKEVLQSLTP